MLDQFDLKTVVLYSLALLLPATYLIYRHVSTLSAVSVHSERPQEPLEKPLKSIMQPPANDLEPPKDDPYTPEELSRFDGTNSNLPIYVAIKGTIFDVSRKADVYGYGKSYNVFAGKDGSRGLGMSSLNPEHAVADYSGLDDKERKVLDDWYTFFEKRYSIIGKVVHSPSSVDSSTPFS